MSTATNRWWRRLRALGLGAALSAVAGAPAAAEYAIVEGVDAARGSVALWWKDTKSCSVGPTTRLENVDGRRIELGELESGSPVYYEARTGGRDCALDLLRVVPALPD